MCVCIFVCMCVCVYVCVCVRDEKAAAIPLPIVKKLMGPYLVFMSSTINGYVSIIHTSYTYTYIHTYSSSY